MSLSTHTHTIEREFDTAGRVTRETVTETHDYIRARKHEVLGGASTSTEFYSAADVDPLTTVGP